MVRDRSSSDGDSRVVMFPRGRRIVRWRPAPSPVSDLAKFEQDHEDDDYRHRMIVNAAAFLFVLVLIGAGLWIAETMADIRKNEDCVLSGRHNCAPVQMHSGRW